MKLDQLTDLYNLISRGTENVSSRKLSLKLRKSGFESAVNNIGFTKLAFDTRRIDQETEYNPRRGLQNYNRSEAFITEAMSQKIINFSKLRKVLVGLKEVYGKEPEWQDSNARVLLSTLDNGLRTITKDGDFTESQPGMGSFDYIEQLLHMRYRLGFDNLANMNEEELKRVILGKDEELTHKDSSKVLEITKSDVAKQGYDTLLEKLFGNVRATADNPNIERIVTISIKDVWKKES
jgi:hypothetical protein